MLNSVAEEEITQEDINILKKIRLEKLEERRSNNADPFLITKYDVTIHNKEAKSRFEEIESQAKEEAGEDEELFKAKLEEKRETVRIAGRMMSRRDMGKANFIDVRDKTDRIQVYVRMNDIGKDEFADFKKWDVGDIIGVEGYVFRTRKGEISVHAQKIVMLSKSLLPLPEKWHGLKDQDTRYRQRYVDLICNPDVMDTFQKRSKIISSIRKYLDKMDFIEVETPMLV